MSRVCPSCGSENSNNRVTCGKCGLEIELFYPSYFLLLILVITFSRMVEAMEICLYNAEGPMRLLLLALASFLGATSYALATKRHWGTWLVAATGVIATAFALSKIIFSAQQGNFQTWRLLLEGFLLLAYVQVQKGQQKPAQ